MIKYSKPSSLNTIYNTNVRTKMMTNENILDSKFFYCSIVKTEFIFVGSHNMKINCFIKEKKNIWNIFLKKKSMLFLFHFLFVPGIGYFSSKI